jgi:mannose-6-phosphate isomerase-like protein (cupin superfamily)
MYHFTMVGAIPPGSKVKFFKPPVVTVKGDPGVRVLSAEKGVLSMVSEMMGARELIIPPSHAVPGHVHEDREKFYVYGGEGLMLVWVSSHEGVTHHRLDHTNPVVAVRAGSGHGVWNPSETERVVAYVITAPKDNTSIEWETSADFLISLGLHETK